MKIQKVLIQGFGCLKDLKMEFHSGLNVVFGTNETGKTTLYRLLRIMLKGFPGWGGDLDAKEVAAHAPWNGGSFAAQITVETDHNRVLEIEADFSEKRYEVKGVRGGSLRPLEARWGLYESVYLVPQGAIGWDSGSGAPVQQVFEAESAEDPEVKTGQAALQMLRARLGQLEALQEDLLQREDALRSEQAKLVEVVQKQRELEREIFETEKQAQELGRALQANIKALQLLERRYHEFANVPIGDLPALREMWAHIKRLREDERELDRKADDITQTIKQLEAEYEELKRYAGLTRRDISQMRFLRDERERRAAVTEMRLKELEKERKRQEEARERLATIRRAVDEDWDELERKLNHHEAQLETVDLEIRRLREQHRHLSEEELPRLKKKNRRAFVGVLTGALLILGGGPLIWLFKTNLPLLLTGMLVALLGAGLLSAFGMMLLQISGERSQKESTARELTTKLEELDQRKTNIGVSLQAILTRTECQNPDGVRRLIREGRTLAAQVPTFTLEPYQKALQEAQNEERRARQMLVDLLADLGFSMDEFPDSRMLETKWEEAQAVQGHLQETRAEYDRIRQQLLTLAQQRVREEGLFGERLNAVGATSLEEFEQRAVKRATYEHLQQTLAEINQTIGGLPLPETDESPATQAVEDVDALMKNAETVAKQFRMTRERYDHLVKARVEGANQAKRLPALEEMSVRLQVKRGELTLHRAALNRARARLQNALDEYTRALSPVVNQKLSHYLTSLTAGAYHEGFAERSLALSLKTDRPIPEAQMSYATRSQAHLAFRLALADLVEERLPINLPMILDEPLAHWDNDRALTALRVLAEISQKRQIILFTSNSTLMDSLSQLPAVRVLRLPSRIA